MVGGPNWPALGVQPPNSNEHAMQIIAEATALLELDNSKRGKLPAPNLDAFLNSIVAFAKKSREQPSVQELSSKLDQLQLIVDDITLTKNAVNHATPAPNPDATGPATRVSTWADLVCSGSLSYPSAPTSRPSTTLST